MRFSIDGCEKHERVYLGKIPDTDYPEVDIYWLRLVPDGGSEYLFHSKEELFTVKAFDGKSLEDLWDQVTIREICGCRPEDSIGAYVV